MKLSLGIRAPEQAVTKHRSVVLRDAARSKTGQARQGWFLQIVPLMHRARTMAASNGGVFAFTATSSGEGVTFVVQALARELVLAPNERVLMITADSLGHLTPGAVLSESTDFVEVESNIWALPEPQAGLRRTAVTPSQDLLAALRQQFTFVLVDCRALRVSAEVLRLAPYTEGVVLVVAAGQARREQVEQVQRVIQIATTKLMGCILNKRTYPVPDALYQRL